jgi:FxsC-like protein
MSLPRARRSGPQHVYFVIVAGHKQELAEVRNELRHYGREPFDWAPYRPELDQRISVFAQSVAAGQDLTSQLAEAAEVDRLLDHAAGRNELVVLLVDVWTTRIGSYRDHMNKYDRRNEPSTAVMVPLSRDDDEASEDAEQLYEDLERAFPRNIVRSDDLFRIQIETSSGFREQLADVLVKAQGRVFRSGNVGRSAGSRSWAERPMMQFPDQEVDQ